MIAVYCVVLYYIIELHAEIKAKVWHQSWQKNYIVALVLHHW